MEVPENPRVREALAIAMKSLVRRSRLSGEIAQKLHSKEFSEEEISAVLAHLSQNSLLNDERTLQEHLGARSGRHAVGAEKLRAELLRKGANQIQIEEGLASRTDEDEVSAMLSALEGRRWQAHEKVRAGRFLASRGFAAELISGALDRYFGPESD